MDSPDAAASATALALAAGHAMFARDRASQALGLALAEVRPGYARLTMTVRDDMLNGHQSCHGGFIFALADSAFAFACNSHNHIAVGAACSIDYLAPGRPGDVLEAEAIEQILAGRSGIYDVRVTNQEGGVVALFRGKSQRVGGQVVAAVVPQPPAGPAA
ncbi:MAG: hydroxyphenylacetyl-CoA thioesterase PaaI [Pseudomonadota bacterium]